MAIARGHVECVRALLAEGQLQSEWLWLPQQHVLQESREHEEGEAVEYESDSVDNVLCEWRCCCERPSERTATSHRPSAQCDHIRAHSTLEAERESVLHPKQSAFFAFSLIRMALESSNRAIKQFFLHSFEIDFQKPIWDHSGFFRVRSEDLNENGPLCDNKVAVRVLSPLAILIDSEYYRNYSSFYELCDAGLVSRSEPFFIYTVDYVIHDELVEETGPTLKYMDPFSVSY